MAYPKLEFFRFSLKHKSKNAKTFRDFMLETNKCDNSDTDEVIFSKLYEYFMVKLKTDFAMNDQQKKCITLIQNPVGRTINKFGRIMKRADHKGRILRGLDCSGWVSWVYETAISKDLNAEGTPHLASTGVGIKRKNLEPGDVAVKVKDGSHVVIFLAWANDGKMYAIHENASANNVSTGEIEAYYPYYRNLLLTQP